MKTGRPLTWNRPCRDYRSRTGRVFQTSSSAASHRTAPAIAGEGPQKKTEEKEPRMNTENTDQKQKRNRTINAEKNTIKEEESSDRIQDQAGSKSFRMFIRSQTVCRLSESCFFLR